MKLFREDAPAQALSRFRAKQLLLELALGELNSARKEQVEYWIKNCKETEAEWLSLNKAIDWCEQVQRDGELVESREDETPATRRKKFYKPIFAVFFVLAVLLGGAYLFNHFYDFNASNFQLLAKRDKIRSHLEALQIEIATSEANFSAIEQLLDRFKKDGTEVKVIPGQQANEKSWSAFVPQSHVHELIEQIKTFGLVRIPEGDSAELVSDGQIQIILRSKTP